MNRWRVHSSLCACTYVLGSTAFYCAYSRNFRALTWFRVGERNQGSVTFQTCWPVMNVQRKFLILLTVDHRPQIKAVILIFMTRKMYSYSTFDETVMVVFMLMWLTLISCGRIWEIMPNIKKFLLDYVHVKIVLRVQLTPLISSNNFLLRISYRKLWMRLIAMHTNSEILQAMSFPSRWE